MMDPRSQTLERDALVGRLVRVAEPRKVFGVFAQFCHLRFGGDATAVMARDRRRQTWSVVSMVGSGLSVTDCSLFTEPTARDPLDALHRIARPLRPHARLAGGCVVLRRQPPFAPRDAGRLGRLARVVSAELERRDRASVGAAANRLYRKLACGVRPVDVLYHVLDEAVRLTAADHSASVLLACEDAEPETWRVAAEKLARDSGPSVRVGAILSRGAMNDPLEAPPALRPLPSHGHRVALSFCSQQGREGLLVIRSCGGDRFDAVDRDVLTMLGGPAVAGINLLGSR